MDITPDKEKTLEVIERMMLARIGEYDRWDAIVKKISEEEPLNRGETEYYASMTRIYKDSAIASRSRIYHVKLSEQDEKPPCKVCGGDSLYYCNMNDQYFCAVHVVGHDENER